MNDLETVQTVVLDICGLCLNGSGGECHVPGCALWMNRAPDIAIFDHPSVQTLEHLIAERDAAVARAEAAMAEAERLSQARIRANLRRDEATARAEAAEQAVRRVRKLVAAQGEDSYVMAYALRRALDGTDG